MEVRQGVHTAPTRALRSHEAADDWIAYVELEGRERSTVAQYRQHVTCTSTAPRRPQARQSDDAADQCLPR